MQLAQITEWQRKVLMIDWPGPWAKLCIIIHNCYFWLAWFVLDLWLRKQFEIISVRMHWQWWMNWMLLVPNIGLDGKQITLAMVVFCDWIYRSGKCFLFSFSYFLRSCSLNYFSKPIKYSILLRNEKKAFLVTNILNSLFSCI